MNELVIYGGALLVALYVFWVWLGDLLAWRRHMSADPSGSAARAAVFPGATPVGWTAVAVAVAGAVVLLAAETAGEYALRITALQTKMTLLFGFYTLAAAFVEELIFRGFLVYDKGTRAQLIAGMVAVSLLFAIGHPYMWKWSAPPGGDWWHFWQGRLSIQWGRKAAFSTAIVFVRSLGFYCLRYWPANPLRSLIPPIAAHLTTNAGVLIVKGLQGSIAGWY